MLVQLLALNLEAFGVLRDLLLGREGLLAEVVEFGDHADIVDELLAITMDLFESESLIDGAEVGFLFGPAFEVEIGDLRRVPLALFEQRTGAQVGHRVFGASLDFDDSDAKGLVLRLRVIEVHQPHAYPVSVSVGAIVSAIEDPLTFHERRLEPADPGTARWPLLNLLEKRHGVSLRVNDHDAAYLRTVLDLTKLGQQLGDGLDQRQSATVRHHPQGHPVA